MEIIGFQQTVSTARTRNEKATLKKTVLKEIKSENNISTKETILIPKFNLKNFQDNVRKRKYVTLSRTVSSRNESG